MELLGLDRLVRSLYFNLNRVIGRARYRVYKYIVKKAQGELKNTRILNVGMLPFEIDGRVSKMINLYDLKQDLLFLIGYYRANLMDTKKYRKIKGFIKFYVQEWIGPRLNVEYFTAKYFPVGYNVKLVLLFDKAENIDRINRELAGKLSGVAGIGKWDLSVDKIDWKLTKKKLIQQINRGKLSADLIKRFYSKMREDEFFTRRLRTNIETDLKKLKTYRSENYRDKWAGAITDIRVFTPLLNRVMPK